MKLDAKVVNDEGFLKLRRLGSLEQWFWQMGQHRPNHFVMAAEVHGHVSREQWMHAADRVVGRHPLLSSVIQLDEHGEPHYWRSQKFHLPIAFKPWIAEIPWKDEVEAELHLAINLGRPPLMRMTVLESSGKCMLVVSFHHSVADGVSSLFIIRDLLNALSGMELVPLDVPPSQDELISALNLTFTPPQAEPSVRFAYRELAEAEPHVEIAELDPRITSLLLKGARQEETTLHGAVAAAAVRAGRSITDQWRQSMIRVFSPVNLRKTLNVDDSSVITLGVGPSSYPASGNDTLWEVARSTKRQLQSFLTADAPAGVQALFDYLTVGRASVDAVAEAAAELLGFDLMISNLQALPFATRFGALSLHRVFGPAVTFSYQGEQDLGVVTVDGTLCLSHTSYAPLPGFLQAVVDELTAAAEAFATLSNEVT